MTILLHKTALVNFPMATTVVKKIPTNFAKRETRLMKKETLKGFALSDTKN